MSSSEGSPSLTPNVRVRPALLALALALPFLPWLVLHGFGLWVRPHYQFFPLVLLGAGVLAVRGLKEPGAVGSPSRVGPALLGVSWLLLAASLFLFSPWGGAVAALVALAGLALTVGGRSLAYRLAPAWLFLGLVIPPPSGLDGQLIVGLKYLTTACSSRALDQLGVLHLVSGNVIEVPGKKLLVEEACSGVHSLFAVLSCTLFLIFYTRTPWLRAVLLLTAAVGWVLLANIVRVTAIALCYTRWRLDLSAGWSHEALGWLLVGCTVGLIVSTARLFLFVSGPESAAPPPPAAPAESSLRSVVPQRLAGWPPLAFGVLGAVELVALVPYFTETASALSPRPIVLALDKLDADALPARIGPWERTGFETKQRTIDDNNFGDYSRTWTYRASSLNAFVSVDYPFPGWHDLTVCYQNIGWKIAQRDKLTARSDDAVPDGACVEARLDKPFGEHSHLVFGLLNGRGEFAAAPFGAAAQDFGDRLTLRLLEPAGRWRRFLGHQDGEPRSDEPLYQIQVYVACGVPLRDGERSQVLALFGQTARVFRAAAPHPSAGNP